MINVSNFWKAAIWCKCEPIKNDVTINVNHKLHNYLYSFYLWLIYKIIGCLRKPWWISSLFNLLDLILTPFSCLTILISFCRQISFQIAGDNVYPSENAHCLSIPAFPSKFKWATSLVFPAVLLIPAIHNHSWIPTFRIFTSTPISLPFSL